MTVFFVISQICLIYSFWLPWSTRVWQLKWWQHCYHLVYIQVRVGPIGSSGVSSSLCKKQFLLNYARLQLEESNKMKAWNGEINWHYPKEPSLMPNDIRELMTPKFFPSFVLQLRKTPNQENWPERGSNPGPLGERQRCYPSTTAVVNEQDGLVSRIILCN